MVDRQWLQSLQLFLNKTLTPIIPNKDTRNKFLSAKSMTVWVTAFTHETVSPTNNYEDLEYTGDTVLKWAFPKYLKRLFPSLNKGQLTELHSAYMSKMHQAEMSRRMGLAEHIRVTGMDRANLNLETDVFESFFGALEKVADNILDGSGTAYCFNMIIHLYKDTEINFEQAKGSAKTQVIQMFVRFDLPKPLEQSPGTEVTINANPKLSQLLGVTELAHSSAFKNKEAEYEAYRDMALLLQDRGLINISYNRFQERGGSIDFTVALRPQHMKFLETYGINLRDNRIGYAKAPTKKEAEHLAYEMALNTLAQYGITTQWAEEAKHDRDLSTLEILPYRARLEEKYKREGYESVYFFIPRKTVTARGAIVELIGVLPSGVHVVLTHTYATERDNSYSKAKFLVIRKYLGLA